MKEWGKSGERLLTLSGKVWRVGYRIQYDYYFSKYSKEIFNLQGAWPFQTHYSLRSTVMLSHSRGHPLSTTWGRDEQLCGVELWEPSPKPSQIKEHFCQEGVQTKRRQERFKFRNDKEK